MKIKVLGSAAGGGFPQWNCNCPNCHGVRSGRIAALPRTQSSIAVQASGSDWVVINASPDILTQIRATAQLQPARAIRDSAICAVVLMDAQIDHVTGLLMLRERSTPLPVYATKEVAQDLTDGLSVFRALSSYCGVDWRPISPSSTGFSVPELPGIEFTAIPIDSKAPPYSPHRNNARRGDNLGLILRDIKNGTTAFYAPGLGAITPDLLAIMVATDVLLVDGTFWSEDEMIRLGLSGKRAAEMGHLPQSGPGGMIEALSSLPARRKILIHINNSNPILREDAVERHTLTKAGIEVAFDGMEIVL